MDRVFKSHTGAEDAAMLAQAQRDVGLIDFLNRAAGVTGDSEKA